MNNPPSEAPDKAGVVERLRAELALWLDLPSRKRPGRYFLLDANEVHHLLAALTPPPVVEEAGSCYFCAGKCRGHSLTEKWVPEPGSQAARDAIAPTPTAGEEAVEPQPVAWRWRYYGHDRRHHWTVRQSPISPCEPSDGLCGIEVEPLYAALPSHRGLTDESRGRNMVVVYGRDVLNILDDRPDLTANMNTAELGIIGLFRQALATPAPSPTLITEEMVERGARAVWNELVHRCDARLPRDIWPHLATACLTAALALPEEGKKDV